MFSTLPLPRHARCRLEQVKIDEEAMAAAAAASEAAAKAAEEEVRVVVSPRLGCTHILQLL